jgi:hypothetical protein
MGLHDTLARGASLACEILAGRLPFSAGEVSDGSGMFLIDTFEHVACIRVVKGSIGTGRVTRRLDGCDVAVFAFDVCSRNDWLAICFLMKGLWNGKGKGENGIMHRPWIHVWVQCDKGQHGN